MAQALLFFSVIEEMSSLQASGPFYSHGLILILAWISNDIYYKVWDEITYIFPKLHVIGRRVDG